MPDERYEWTGDSWVPKAPPSRPKPERRGKHRCELCAGSGQVPGIRKTGMGTGMGSMPGTCPDCDGVGWVTNEA